MAWMSNALPGIPEGLSILPLEPAAVTIDSLIREGWHHRGSHVDFSAAEEIPLKDGRFLGQGITMGVYESRWQGHLLAVKKVHLKRNGRSDREMRIWRQEVEKEAEAIKRLDHHHVIRLIGTYTYQDVFGLLLWPVATCDLATFLVDIDMYRSSVTRSPMDDFRRSGSCERLRILGLDISQQEVLDPEIKRRLIQMAPCLIMALQYIHGQSLKHKDIKPNNILLSSGGLWLTDFGVSTDISGASRSLTDNGIRGTPKYFSPEMANYELCGRRSDIFSLGCIFIQIFWSGVFGRTMEEFDAHLLSDGPPNFRDNLQSIASWCEAYQEIHTNSLRSRRLLVEVMSMLRADQSERPYAPQVAQSLAILDHLADLEEGAYSIFLPCCAPDPSPLLKTTSDNVREHLLKSEVLAQVVTTETQDCQVDVQEGQVLEAKRPRSIFSIRSRVSSLSAKSIWGWFHTAEAKRPWKDLKTRTAPAHSGPYGAHLRRVYRSQ